MFSWGSTRCLRFECLDEMSRWPSLLLCMSSAFPSLPHRCPAICSERNRGLAPRVSWLPQVYLVILKPRPCRPVRSTSKTWMKSLLLGTLPTDCIDKAIAPSVGALAVTTSSFGSETCSKTSKTFTGTQTPLLYHQTVLSQLQNRALRPLELLQCRFWNIICPATPHHLALGKTPSLHVISVAKQHAAQHHPLNRSHGICGESRSRGAHAPPRHAGSTI